MADIVIVAFRPKPGQDAAVRALTAGHVPALRALGLVTGRPPVIMAGADGTILEMFEWADGAMDAAHENPAVLALWARYAEVCDYVPLRDLPEAAALFATFKPLDG